MVHHRVDRDAGHLVAVKTPACSQAIESRMLRNLRLRPPRHARPLSGMRHRRRAGGVTAGSPRRPAPRGRMSAVKRRLFNVMASLSLLLLLLACGLWARSEFVL